MTNRTRAGTRNLSATALGAVLIVLAGAQPANAAAIPYRIDTQTCDLSGAGTDSYVSVRLHGAIGTSGWLGLNDPNDDDFERGDLDQFYVSLPSNLGTISSVDVSFLPDGSNAAWCLSWIRVNGPTGTSPKLRYNGSSLWFVSSDMVGFD